MLKPVKTEYAQGELTFQGTPLISVSLTDNKLVSVGTDRRLTSQLTREGIDDIVAAVRDALGRDLPRAN